jgi:hypothetical protein
MKLPILAVVAVCSLPCRGSSGGGPRPSRSAECRMFTMLQAQPCASGGPTECCLCIITKQFGKLGAVVRTGACSPCSRVSSVPTQPHITLACCPCVMLQVLRCSRGSPWQRWRLLQRHPTRAHPCGTAGATWCSTAAWSALPQAESNTCTHVSPEALCVDTASCVPAVVCVCVEGLCKASVCASPNLITVTPIMVKVHCERVPTIWRRD